MAAVKGTYTLEELVKNARCTRNLYRVDRCGEHGNSPYPYDEKVCNSVLRILGCTPRFYLGDGRARGKPILPVK